MGFRLSIAKIEPSPTAPKIARSGAESLLTSARSRSSILPSTPLTIPNFRAQTGGQDKRNKFRFEFELTTQQQPNHWVRPGRSKSMNKLEYLGLSVVMIVFALAFAAPANAQSGTFNFGNGNVLSTGPNGTSFSFGNGGSPMGVGYTGSYRSYDQASSAATGNRFQQPPAGAYNQGAWGTQFNSSGDQGEAGRGTGTTPGELADSDRSLHNYQSSRGDRGSKDQTPMTRGGLPYARTAVDSLNGSFGMQFGYTQIPSGKFKYGFSQTGWAPYLGTTSSKSQPFSMGKFLPATGTSSLDINTVHR